MDVRWGDNHGGYGEHYWDYNHGGQQDGDSKESQQAPRYAAYEEGFKGPPAYAVEFAQRGKREQGLLKDVEFINDNAKSLILDGNAQKHGGNYRSADDYRGKREQQINGEDLVFKSDSGTLFDKRTGQQYELRPIYSDKDFQF
ncbi:hypothetical protein NQ314_005602 [Rhamnusium bicolor]|uniref:Uncharacterized protein n=1 Tax=Rhamnusium bicolor TaxID=1586634 RepID=A0AAV8ZGC4_9CUCU|nr:hypothetical protein NQ314_005602 [Rhamnusium bicolor]